MLLLILSIVVASVPFGRNWVQQSKAQTMASTPDVVMGDGSVRFLKSNIESAIWAITSRQIFRACISNASPTNDGDNDDIDTFVLFMRSTLGQVIERELRVTAGEFRCIDVSRSEFIAAGVVPEATGRIQFEIDIVHRHEVASVNSAQEIVTGSIETIETVTGDTTVYQKLDANRFRLFSEGVPVP
jgi:hypothetical protein